MNRRSPTTPCHGFTLIETISTIVILGIVGSLASLILFTGLNAYTRAATAAQLHTEVSIALDRIDRELRNIHLDPSAAGIAPNIASITSTSIAWNDDYSLTFLGGKIMLVADGGPSLALLSDVTALSIVSYNESNTALAASLSGAACDPIRRLSVAITVARSGVTETLRTKLFLRSTLDRAGAA